MVTEKEIREQIIERLKDRALRLGFKDKYLVKDFDLIKAGLLDSMSFIEFIAELENQYKIEIDFERYNPSEFTTLAGLSKVIVETLSTT